MQKGFTLIELVIVIALIAILSSIIMFSTTQYINKGKDSNIAGSLATLIAAGEVYYNGFPNAYGDININFCDSSAWTRAVANMPVGLEVVHCNVAGSPFQSWAACARKFSDTSKAFCVDSRGVKEEISSDLCVDTLIQCPELN